MFNVRVAFNTVILGAVVAISTLAFAQDNRTAPVDQKRLDLGRQVWEDGGCAGCHGARGQGGTEPDMPVGPRLPGAVGRERLTRAISCGVPGTPMAAWLRGAYTSTPCYGKGPGTVPTGATVIGVFSDDQINALVDFILHEFSSQDVR